VHRLASNLWSSCLGLPHAGIAHVPSCRVSIAFDLLFWQGHRAPKSVSFPPIAFNPQGSIMEILPVFDYFNSKHILMNWQLTIVKAHKQNKLYHLTFHKPSLWSMSIMTFWIQENRISLQPVLNYFREVYKIFFFLCKLFQ
jgi:hypothetical protein